MAKTSATPTFKKWNNETRMNEAVAITVGMGVTESCGSDAYPYEVIEIRTANKIVIRSMNAERTPGSNYLDNSWVITPNPEGRVEILRKGRVSECWQSAGGTRYYPGYAGRHHDPHF